MDINRIIGTFFTTYPPKKRNTKWMNKAVVSKFLWCPIIKILSLIILLSLPCENSLVTSNWGCQKKTQLVGTINFMASAKVPLSFLCMFPTRAKTTVTLENSHQVGECSYFISPYEQFWFSKDVCQTLHVKTFIWAGSVVFNQNSP